MTRSRRTLLGGLAGLAAAAGGVGAAALAATVLGGTSPVIALGNVVIDRTPGPVKDWAVETLGENDKPVLLGSVLLVMALAAVAVGILGTRRPVAGLVAAGLLNVVAMAAAVATDGVSAGGLVPGLLGLVVSVGLLWTALRGLGSVGNRGDAAPARMPGRRGFLTAVGAGAVLAAAGGVVGSLAAKVGEASRAAVRLPRPRRSAPPVPPGAALDVRGISPYVTPNADFYRVDTVLQLPQVDADEWRLRIHGMVDREVTLSLDDILAMPLVEERITLTCVSNQVGDEYIGNATWLGVPTRTLLEMAGMSAKADAVLSTSVDGMTIGTPLAALTDDRGALLAVGMNGQPLPIAHGFPARLVTPGLYGYVSATKWVTDLEVTRFADFSAYWTDRGWDEQAPIKTASRIDVPRQFASVEAGEVDVAGVAYAQRRGVDRVEVRVDGGPWQRAELAAEDSIDTWRQWRLRWEADPGQHKLEVRATDGKGHPQTSRRVPPRPDGATGWHSVIVTVR